MSQANIAEQKEGATELAHSGHLRDAGLAWEVLGEQRIGLGWVAWLRVTPRAEALFSEVYVGGAKLRAPHEITITETGQVPEIEVHNPNEGPVLVTAHRLLVGGLQTRAVERSVLMAARSHARVPVKCFEAGRWEARDEPTARSLAESERVAVRTRWSTTQNMAEQLRRSGRFAADQSAVWQHIDEELTRSRIQSKTRSYEAYLEEEKRPRIEAARRALIRPPAAANGVALFFRGGGHWVEAFPSNDALGREVNDLVSDLFEVTSGRRSRTQPEEVPIKQTLSSIKAAELHRLEPIAGAVGEAYALVGRDPHGAVAGSILFAEGALVHLAVGAPPAVREAPKPLTKGDAERRAELGGDSPATISRPQLDLAAMRAIFTRARDLVPEEMPPRDRVQGYRLVRVLDRSISWVDIHAGGDGYAVLGSHDRCDLVLSNDSSIWLRHMVAACARLEDGSLGLRLIDLKTNIPFFLDDDSPQWSVTANGPFAMRLGKHVICGFPIEQRGPGASHGALGSVHEADPREDPHATRVAPDASVDAPPPRVEALDRVPIAPKASNYQPVAPVSQIHDLLVPITGTEHVRVTLERGGMGASVELPLTALDTGVLLGRALNCFDGGLRRIFCEAISRTHVLIFRDRDGVFALDLCSTNGTRVNGHRIRRHRLDDHGSTLELGKKVVFRWVRG